MMVLIDRLRFRFIGMIVIGLAISLGGVDSFFALYFPRLSIRSYYQALYQEVISCHQI